MVSAGEAVGLLIVVGVHTFLSMSALRFFRLQLNTWWGTAVYAAAFVPLALFVSTLVLTGALGLGAAVGRQAALLLVFVVPMAFGFALDLFWVPPPEEIGLPDTTDGEDDVERT